MRTYQQWLTYKELELLSPAEAESLTYQPTLQSFLDKIWCYLRDSWNPDNEPQIREIIDRSGKTCWEIYELASDQWLQFNSVQDVLIWIEEHQRHRSQTISWNCYT